MPVSAIHGRLSGELLDAIVDALPPEAGGRRRRRRPDERRRRSSPSRSSAGPTSASRRCSTGWWGRTARSCTTCRARRATRSTRSSRPKTVRCASSTPPGLRRKSRIDEPTEYYSLVRALEAIDRADAALLLIDATEGVTHQDQRLAERIDAAGTAVVIVLNKWDLLDAEAARQGARRGRRQARVPHLRARAPDLRAHRASACTNCCPRCAKPRPRTTSASRPRALNRVLRDAQAAHPPPVQKRHRPRDPLRDPGRDRPADVHAVRDPAAAAAVPPLPGAQAPGGLRPRPHADQDPGPAPQRVAPHRDR